MKDRVKDFLAGRALQCTSYGFTIWYHIEYDTGYGLRLATLSLGLGLRRGKPRSRRLPP